MDMESKKRWINHGNKSKEAPDESKEREVYVKKSLHNLTTK